MKTQASYEIQPYEVSEYELRIHWNIEQKTKEDMDGSTITYWEADEALCDRRDSRGALIEKIMQTSYPTYGAEIAAIRNGGQAAEDHQALREQAKALADGWLNKE
jgi:hypothetical protein